MPNESNTKNVQCVESICREQKGICAYPRPSVGSGLVPDPTWERKCAPIVGRGLLAKKAKSNPYEKADCEMDTPIRGNSWTRAKRQSRARFKNNIR